MNIVLENSVPGNGNYSHSISNNIKQNKIKQHDRRTCKPHAARAKEETLHWAAQIQGQHSWRADGAVGIGRREWFGRPRRGGGG